MTLLYLHEFLIEFQSLDKAVQLQLRKKLDELARQAPAQFAPLALRGERFKGLYKLRIGDWRLIYKLDGQALVFVTLGRRSDVYR